MTTTVHAGPSRSGPALVTRDHRVAARCLVRGGLVGLPTETVYGLAADAENPSAVGRIYTAKGRPADHPVIVHVAGPGALDPAAGWVERVPDYARRLADELWPGPLTLVLPRAGRAGHWVTGGLDGVGLRAPDHHLAQLVLAAVADLTGRRHPGLAAPSANRFGRVSPTRAEDVVTELGDVLVAGRDCVVDGGASDVGVESTIVDCTGPAPVVLRPGSIGPDRLEQAGRVAPATRPHRPVRAPGTLAAHYAPRARVELATGVDQVPRLLGGPGSAGLLAPADVATPGGVLRLSAPRGAVEFARVLYAALREADAFGLDRVVVLPPEDTRHPDLVAAIRDRLARAAVGSAGGGR